MLPKYRNTMLFEAERFDNSAEMVEKYDIRHRVKPRGPMIDSNYKVLTIGGWMNIEKGQWILTNDEGDHLVVDDDYFHEVYERVE